MRIYCDMDDILCETAVSLCGLADRMFGKRIAYDAVRDFNLQKTFSLSDAEFRRFMDAAHAHEFLLGYAPTPGAVEGVRALVAAGHEIEIVTGRPAFTHRATRAWLDAAGLRDCPVTYVDKYGRPQPVDPSAPRTISLDQLLARHYDVAIDDSPVVLPALARWSDTRVLVFERPWNRAYALAPNMTRVRGWGEILKEALGISVGLRAPDSGVKRCEHGARSAECLQRAV